MLSLLGEHTSSEILFVSIDSTSKSLGSNLRYPGANAKDTSHGKGTCFLRSPQQIVSFFAAV